MKINPILLLIAAGIAALIGFGFYSANKAEELVWAITIGSGLLSLITLSGIFAVNFDARGGTGNVRIISGLFFAISLVSNIIFNFLNFTLPPYIIINGILFLLYILIGYGVTRALK
jgi:hypothetical protein